MSPWPDTGWVLALSPLPHEAPEYQYSNGGSA